MTQPPWNICNCAVATVLKGSTYNFQELIRSSVPTKLFLRIWISMTWGHVNFRTRPLQGNWKNVQMLFILKVQKEPCFLSQDYDISDHWRWPICRFDPITCPSCHLRSFDFKSVFLVETHRMICNMTYLGHDVTSSDLDLGQILASTSQGQHAYISTHLDERNTMEAELFR